MFLLIISATFPSLPFCHSTFSTTLTFLNWLLQLPFFELYTCTHHLEALIVPAFAPTVLGGITVFHLSVLISHFLALTMSDGIAVSNFSVLISHSFVIIFSPLSLVWILSSHPYFPYLFYIVPSIFFVIFWTCQFLWTIRWVSVYPKNPCFVGLFRF